MLRLIVKIVVIDLIEAGYVLCELECGGHSFCWMCLGAEIPHVMHNSAHYSSLQACVPVWVSNQVHVGLALHDF